ncbi:sigma-70 family RNA polymerase sigma factor, partial [candidate division KSB1 bacterium]|nr:sigma-70 family RNA polymerase sigma factor [candidate division KSB1 bacterium]
KDEPDEIARKLYPVLSAIARRYLPERFIVDAVQETLLRFLSRRAEKKAIENWEAYVIGILKNVIREMQRDHQRYAAQIVDMSDTDKNQEEQLQQQEEKKIIRRCFDKLNSEAQQLLYAHFFEGRSFLEMERMTGKPHTNLHRWCKKSLKKFAKELKKCGIFPNINS